jgi:methionyl-tRNA synthetase
MAAETISQAYNLYLEAMAEYIGAPFQVFMVLFLILTLWILVWKGLALWKSARRKQPIWFVIILITNTLAILPIIYLLIYYFKEKKQKKSRKKKKSSKNI